MTTALGLAALSACGGSNVTVGTSQSMGSVGGVVLDAASGLPPAKDAKVAVIAGDKSFWDIAVDAATGAWNASKVPSGSVIVRVTAPDRFDTYLTGTLAASAGNFPVENATLTLGPIALVPSTGTIAFRLVDQNGAPVPNVRVAARTQASYFDLQSGTPVARGVVNAEGMSGPDGVVTIAKLPDFAKVGPLLSDAVTINVPPIRVMGGDGYQFLGLTMNINGTQFSSAFGQTPTIVLAGPRSPLQVLSSNVDWFETGTPSPIGSQVNPSGPITIAFNQAVDPGSVRVQLMTEFGALASAMATPAVTGNLVSITFSKALDPGTRYNLAFAANAAYKDQAKVFSTTAPFFVAAAQGTPVAVSPSSRIDPNNPNDFIVVFTEPVGLGAGSQAQVPCIVYYEADLDGNGQVTSAGEWNAGGNNLLRCDPSVPGLVLRPDEQGSPNPQPVTGYTTQWRLAVRSACAPNYLCSTSGRAVHLVFSRNTTPGVVFRRANGVPVPDLVFNLPAF